MNTVPTADANGFARNGVLNQIPINPVKANYPPAGVAIAHIIIAQPKRVKNLFKRFKPSDLTCLPVINIVEVAKWCIENSIVPTVDQIEEGLRIKVETTSDPTQIESLRKAQVLVAHLEFKDLNVQTINAVENFLATREALGKLGSDSEDSGTAIANEHPEDQIVSARDLMSMVFKERKYLVEKLVVLGLTVLAGGPKLGKSWMMLNIALAIAKGGRALGSLDVIQAGVLYLALEDNLPRLQNRIKIVSDSDEIPANLHLVTNWPRWHEGGVTALRRWITQHPEVKLLILDTSKMLRPPVDLFHKSSGSVIPSEAEESLSAAGKDFSTTLMLRSGRNDTAMGLMKEV